MKLKEDDNVVVKVADNFCREKMTFT
jgi:hypothetical protein